MATAAPRSVLCYHCRRRFDVGAKTMSVPCPHCHKPLIVEDVVVRGYKPVKNFYTCGKLIVRKGGRIVATTIEAQLGIECHGALAADTVSGGPVVLGTQAEWKGNLRAPSLAVRAGAKVLNGYFTIPDNPLAEYA
jgi:DNA-directed RNA polymerase subunit RPC12/RpoP